MNSDRHRIISMETGTIQIIRETYEILAAEAEYIHVERLGEVIELGLVHMTPRRFPSLGVYAWTMGGP